MKFCRSGFKEKLWVNRHSLDSLAGMGWGQDSLIARLVPGRNREPIAETS